LGADFEEAWKRIVLADAVFVNTDRHMRNFGVIRSSRTGEILRLAPNYDNNQAYLANPGGTYSDGMLKLYMKQADERDYRNLKTLTDEMKKYPYLKHAFEACRAFV
jgi:serine/threonine protein kinase HipA of HipAB toxin-antitoxin module